jgi:hypothetical protein
VPFVLKTEDPPARRPNPPQIRTPDRGGDASTCAAVDLAVSAAAADSAEGLSDGDCCGLMCVIWGLRYAPIPIPSFERGGVCGGGAPFAFPFALSLDLCDGQSDECRPRPPHSNAQHRTRTQSPIVQSQRKRKRIASHEDRSRGSETRGGVEGRRARGVEDEYAPGVVCPAVIVIGSHYSSKARPTVLALRSIQAIEPKQTARTDSISRGHIANLSQTPLLATNEYSRRQSKPGLTRGRYSAALRSSAALSKPAVASHRLRKIARRGIVD